MSRNKETAMNVVRAALGNDLNLSAAKAAILRVIAIGKNFYAFNGILRGRYDRGTTPDRARGADAVNRNAVTLSLLTIGNNLRPVFGLEYAIRTAGLPSTCLGTW